MDTQSGQEIVRRVHVDGTRSAPMALNATRRDSNMCNDSTVFTGIPRGVSGDVEVVFFKADDSAFDQDDCISEDNLENQFTQRGLAPADLYSVAKVNEDDSDFANDHPNGTHWKDKSGRWCFVSFNRRFVYGKCVHIGYADEFPDGVWKGKGWLFAGIRLPA